MFESCSACEGGEIGIDENLPVDLDYDLDLLYNFLRKDPAPTLTFYGGEPLLRIDLIKTIMDHAPVRRFMIQTNGLLLNRLEPRYINRFSTILVSVDGPEILNDSHRGNGTYRKVMENVKKMVSSGFTGEVIGRMTVTEDTDIVSAVLWMADNPDYSFSSIHWQLDANFSNDFADRTFNSWVQEQYNPGIRTLVKTWINRISEGERIPRWYPFVGTMEDLLNGRSTLLRCGSGYTNYSIMTDGHITPCPVMVGMSEYYLGHIRCTHPLDLPLIQVGGNCPACRIKNFCGGRCLYANIVQPWKMKERRYVCRTVENLYNALQEALPKVRTLIDQDIIQMSDFSCEKFNGCEIIP